MILGLVCPESIRVVGVAYDEHDGLYNPHTASVRIVVDGIVASVYNDGYDTRVASFLPAPAGAPHRRGCALIVS